MERTKRVSKPFSKKNVITDLLEALFLGHSSDKIYIAPSGVQKERIRPQDIFCYTPDGAQVSGPEDKALKASACTPLFFNAYKMREAGSVIHTHSQNAVLVSLINDKVFRITHQEMIKGIKRGYGANAVTLNNYDMLVVPIIDNTPQEEDLEEIMAETMREYPGANAVLVRRHGVFVWGATWEKAKASYECYEYLFELALKMRQLGIDPAAVPENSLYKELVTEEKPVPRQ